jgi:hypothetical protein
VGDHAVTPGTSPGAGSPAAAPTGAPSAAITLRCLRAHPLLPLRQPMSLPAIPI